MLGWRAHGITKVFDILYGLDSPQMLGWRAHGITKVLESLFGLDSSKMLGWRAHRPNTFNYVWAG